jgi:hypothetical protein
MDPVTAGLNLATAIVSLITKIYDDTPKEIRDKNAARWDKFVDGGVAFLTTGKLPDLKP